jgi:hypothetical protein
MHINKHVARTRIIINDYSQIEVAATGHRPRVNRPTCHVSLRVAIDICSRIYYAPPISLFHKLMIGRETKSRDIAASHAAMQITADRRDVTTICV